ncbi:MAG TPA: STAS domain-containing protein [Bacteroidia bacterium]|jgi:anti-sigma B factor antagonist|nr:STAS domain-containing protein [Bacteroidia bacterium]
MSFSFNLVSKEPVLLFSLYGDLVDKNAAHEFLEKVNTAMDEGMNKVVIELSELRYMNSTGLNVLINILTKARKNGGDLVLCGVSRKVQELLVVTKLNSVFTVTETSDEAVAKFNA